MTKKESLKIVPLGGLEEVGINMTLLEYKGQILIIDMGLMFPEETTPGIDYIIPNISYLEGKEKNIVGVFITHGHYDHIGAIPYLTDRLGTSYPIFTGKLAKEIILKRQKEFPYKNDLNIQTIVDGQKEKAGPFELEFVQVNHNIPDSFGAKIKTPVGSLFHTGDFKIDPTPLFDKPMDLDRLKRMGEEGILLLMSDSTRAEEEGHSLSEKEIMENLEKVFKKAKGRIIASTFASLLNRVQQLVAISEEQGRKVAFDGRSMTTNVEIAEKLKYLKIKKGTKVDIRHVDRYPDEKVTIICTGAQGEENAVLARLASDRHDHVNIKPNDTIIFSSSVVPGNEKSVQRLKDAVLRRTKNVYHYEMMDIHAGGHAKPEELKEAIRLLKPRFFMPIEGEYSMRVAHMKIAEEMGIPEQRILLPDNGDIIHLSKDSFSVEKEGAKTDYVLVDGLGVGDVGKIVLRDRERLAEDGIFVVIATINRKTGKLINSPDIISRGFVYLRESKDLLQETRKKVRSITKKAASKGGIDENALKKEMRDKIASYLYSKTQRRPMVLPVIIEV